MEEGVVVLWKVVPGGHASLGTASLLQPPMDGS